MNESGTGVLHRFRQFRTRDVDDYRAELSRRCAIRRLYPTTRDVRFDLDLSVAPLGPVSLLYVHHRGSELAAESVDYLTHYNVHLSLGGHNVLTCADERVVVDRDHAGIVSPTMRADMRLGEDFCQLHVRIEQSALERHLEALLGGPVAGPIRFDRNMDLTSPALASWKAVLSTVVHDLDHTDGLTTHPVAVANLSQLLMTGLLLGHGHDHREQLDDPDSRRSPRAVTRAVDHIEHHLDEPLDLGGIATAAGVSGRSLQRQFRDSVGLSPMAYVQQRRLAAVHGELRDATNSGVTVTDTALRWGFTHLPRFAAAYRARYGVTPSVTLRGGTATDRP